MQTLMNLCTRLLFRECVCQSLYKDYGVRTYVGLCIVNVYQTVHKVVNLVPSFQAVLKIVSLCRKLLVCVQDCQSVYMVVRLCTVLAVLVQGLPTRPTSYK